VSTTSHTRNHTTHAHSSKSADDVILQKVALKVELVRTLKHEVEQTSTTLGVGVGGGGHQPYSKFAHSLNAHSAHTETKSTRLKNITNVNKM